MKFLAYASLIFELKLLFISEETDFFSVGIFGIGCLVVDKMKTNNFFEYFSYN